MIDFKSIPILKADDYDLVFEFLKNRNLTNRYTNDYFQILKILYRPNRCDSVILEYPYFDSEYLSSYYSFYVKKFKYHEKKACRIHFFYKHKYKGYIVIRPDTGYSNLSKSYLDPSFIVDEKAYIMLSPFKAHIYGDTSYVNAFPWMNQQRDFSTCAHVAVWSIMKYYAPWYRVPLRDLNERKMVYPFQMTPCGIVLDTDDYYIGEPTQIIRHEDVRELIIHTNAYIYLDKAENPLVVRKESFDSITILRE